MESKVVGLAIKKERRQPLVEVQKVEIQKDGLVGNISQSAKRKVTFLSREHWEAVQSELNMDLPWITRRANILTEGLTMSELVDKTLKIGNAEFKVEGETEPCGLMDKYFSGLEQALVPDFRGGVCTSIVKPGEILVGDIISVIE